MKISCIFILFLFSFNSLNREKAATFDCEIIVQKIINEEKESILELHNRLKKEKDGEDINGFNRGRILEEENETEEKEEDEEENEQEKNVNSSEDEKKKIDDGNSDEEEDNQENKNEELEEEDDEHIENNKSELKIEIGNLKNKQKAEISDKLIKEEYNKSLYLQEQEGFQYLTYFKCIARGSFYYKEVNFKLNCLKSKDIEIKIFKGDKIVKKINYVYSEYFGHDSDYEKDKEQSLPEINYKFEDADSFIIFRPSDEECILRISYHWRYSIMILIMFLLIFLK